MNTTSTALSLAALTVFISCGAGLIVSWWDDANQRLDNIIRDGLAEIDADRTDDWSTEEWWLK